MKRFKILALIAASSITIVSTLSIANVVHGQVQQGIFNDTTNQLIHDGISIQSSQIKDDTQWNPPLVAAYTIQSSSKSNVVAPEDPINLNILSHEVNLARKHGLNIGAFRVTFVNNDGKVIVDMIKAVEPDADWVSGFDQPGKLSAGEISALLANLPTFGMSRTRLSVSPNREGLFTVILNIQANNTEEANLGLSDIVKQTRSELTKLNKEQGTQIVAFEIKINDIAGQPLLDYINDLQLGHQNWWQSDQLTTDWFPKPGTSTP